MRPLGQCWGWQRRRGERWCCRGLCKWCSYSVLMAMWKKQLQADTRAPRGMSFREQNVLLIFIWLWVSEFFHCLSIHALLFNYSLFRREHGALCVLDEAHSDVVHGCNSSRSFGILIWSLRLKANSPCHACIGSACCYISNLHEQVRNGEFRRLTACLTHSR